MTNSKDLSVEITVYKKNTNYYESYRTHELEFRFKFVSEEDIITASLYAKTTTASCEGIDILLIKPCFRNQIF